MSKWSSSVAQADDRDGWIEGGVTAVFEADATEPDVAFTLRFHRKTETGNPGKSVLWLNLSADELKELAQCAVEALTYGAKMRGSGVGS